MSTDEEEAARYGIDPETYRKLGPAYWKKVEKTAEQFRQQQQWPEGEADTAALRKVWDEFLTKEGLSTELPNPFDFKQLSAVHEFEIVAVSSAVSYL